MPDNSHIESPAGAVFLSYASQDSLAAKLICEALRAAGVEVWFDQSELVGGDSWDQRIRKQISECALFIPILSSTTQARREAYFRLEWKLADERTYLMAEGTPFLLPVTIDGTNERGALVPKSFLAIQWTKLPSGDTPPAFCSRVKRLLDGPGVLPVQPVPAAAGAASMLRPEKATRPWLIPILAAAVLCASLGVWQLWHRGKGAAPAPLTGAQPPSPPTEGQKLAERAEAIWDVPTALSRDSFEAAEELYTRALASDVTNADVWASAARFDAYAIFMGIDFSDERKQKAQTEMGRAMALSPQSPEAIQAQACVFAFATPSPEGLAESDKLYRALLASHPEKKSLAREFGIVLRQEHHFDEAAAFDLKSGNPIEAGWNYFVAGRYVEANQIADGLLATEETIGPLYLKAMTEFQGLEDLEAAYSAVHKFKSTDLMKDEYVSVALVVSLSRRDTDWAIGVLDAFPRDFINNRGWGGMPKRLWLGIANEIADRPNAARAQWQVALQQVQEGLKSNAHDTTLLGDEALILACLGEMDEAAGAYQKFDSFSDDKSTSDGLYSVRSRWINLRMGHKHEVIDSLADLFHKKPERWNHTHANARFSPEFDALRGDPRFERLLRDNLPSSAKPFDSPSNK